MHLIIIQSNVQLNLSKLLANINMPYEMGQMNQMECQQPYHHGAASLLSYVVTVSQWDLYAGYVYSITTTLLAFDSLIIPLVIRNKQRAQGFANT